MLERVGDEVRERLLQAVGVPRAGEVALAAELDRTGPVTERRFLHHRTADLAQVGRARLERDATRVAHPGEVEQVADHVRHAARAQRIRASVRASAGGKVRRERSVAPAWIAERGLRRS